MATINREVYKRLEDGTTVLVEVIQVESVEVNVQDEIAQREAQLLEMYNELQALKNNNQ